MSVQFPSLKPSKRSFKLGQYPVKTYRAASGATVKRAFGNQPYGHALTLSFDNITDETAAQILEHYTSSQGGFERFTLPSSLFAGMGAVLTNQIQAPTQIKWQYVNPPEVESIFVGVSRVTVSLTGELTY